MHRPDFLQRIAAQFEIHPVVALLGPRQCGKTTLARLVADASAGGEVSFFDLEDPADLAALSEPKLALAPLSGLVVLDEIQRLPAVFPVLRVLVDRPDNSARFLVLGSASRDLIRQSSETLAGRIGHIEVTPFSLAETGSDSLDRLWLRGGFPRAFLARSDAAAEQWRKDYISTFLERDIPQLGIPIPAPTLRRFWMMLAHYHGQILNYSELARAFGVADTTIRRYLDILAGTFMIRLLPPWHENISKRQVKAPKLYLRDSGLFHNLIGIGDRRQLLAQPKLGASWEGFALETIARQLALDENEAWFWATHSGAELDLLVIRDGRRIGYEFKFSDRPAVSRSARSALESLQLDHLYLVHPGSRHFPLTPQISALGLSAANQ